MIAILLLLTLNFSWAQYTTVQWSCPQNGKNRNLNIPETATLRINQNGVENFNLFSLDQVMSDTSVNYSECISRFLRDANTSYQVLQAPCAPTGARPAYCLTKPETFEKTLFDQFNGAWTVNRNRAQMRFLRPSYEPAAENLRQLIATGNPPDLMNFSTPYEFNGVSRPLVEFAPIARDELLRRFEARSPETERRKFIEDFAYANSDFLRPVEEIRRTCRNALDCQDKLRIREEVLYTSRRMLERIYSADEVQRRINGLCQAPGSETPQSIADLLDSLRRSSCERNENGEYPLEVGQFRKVERANSGSDYLLRRTASGYEGVINVNFNYTDGAVTATEMRRRAEACLALSNEHMRGPDGTPFRIRMIGNAEAEQLPRNQRPDPVNINLQRINWRSHAGTYSSKVDCDTITHEFLHLFRLVDEYHEGALEAGACRVEVKSTSIMAQSREAYDETVPRAVTCPCDQDCQNIMTGTDEVKKAILTGETLIEASNYEFYSVGCSNPVTTFTTNLQGRRKISSTTNPDGSLRVVELGMSGSSVWEKVMTCSCPAEAETCLQGRERLLRSVAEEPRPTKSCPGNYQNVIRSEYVPAVVPTGLQNGNLVIGTRPRYSNLLHPNHFRKIVAGGCTDRLRGDERPMYDRCAQFAYLKSSDEKCTSEEGKAQRQSCSVPGTFTGAVDAQ